MSARACTHLELFPLDAVQSAEQVLLVCGFTTGFRTGILSSIGNASRHFEQSVLLDHPGNHLHTSTCRRGGTCECVCVHTSTCESLLYLDAGKRPTIDHRHTDIQTHNHSRLRALSRQYSTDSKKVKRDMCASVCACTESRPPSPPFPSHAHADQTHQTPQDPFFSASTPDSVDFICSKRCADFP